MTCALCGRYVSLADPLRENCWSVDVLVLAIGKIHPHPAREMIDEMMDLCGGCFAALENAMADRRPTVATIVGVTNVARARRGAAQALSLRREATLRAPWWRRMAGWLGLLDAGARR